MPNQKEIIDVLGKALGRLSDLVQGVKLLAVHFHKIGAFVQSMAAMMSEKDTEGGLTQILGKLTDLQATGKSVTWHKDQIRQQTMAIMYRLTVMGNISRAYSQISHEYILPGFFNCQHDVNTRTSSRISYSH